MDSAQLRTHEFRRILLIKLSAVGDVVHTIPVLNKLRERYPDARIDWLLKPGPAELIRHHPAVTNVVLFPDQDLRAPWQDARQAFKRFTGIVGSLRSAAYDLVIDMHGQFRTASLAFLTGAPVRIGFDRPRAAVWEGSERKLPPGVYKHAWVGAREGSWLAYTHRMALPTLDVHAVDRYLRLGLMLGFDGGHADFSFPIPEGSTRRAQALLDAHGIGSDAGFVLLAPGTVWETKQWRPAGFAEVARHFVAKGRPVVLVGSRSEIATCREIAGSAPGALDLSGKTTLSELAAVMSRAAVAVTNDSGPMHLAVALDRPVVSVFGPTDAVWIGPYRQPEGVVSADLTCAPCYLRRLRDCPHDHACMAGVPAATVIARIESILAGKPSRAPGSMEPGAQFRMPPPALPLPAGPHRLALARSDR